MNKYEGFKDRADMLAHFCCEKDPNLPTEDEILVAHYSEGFYDGAAFILYKKDGKFYEVNASHCSCYGLEGQWDPEETNLPALLMRDSYGMTNEAYELIKTLAEEEEASNGKAKEVTV